MPTRRAWCSRPGRARSSRSGVRSFVVSPSFLGKGPGVRSVVEDIVRRSILLVSMNDRDGVAGSGRHGADAVALDLAAVTAPVAREEARVRVREAIGFARRGGAEVFVRIDSDL